MTPWLEKKKIQKKDEKTGEETVTEDYDWDKIVKAVKTFVDDYNSVVEEIGNSDEKRVLRNGVWLTGMTKSTEKLLKKTGITIGKGNKLELDEEEFKEAGIATIKSAFYGYGRRVTIARQIALGTGNFVAHVICCRFQVDG